MYKLITMHVRLLSTAVFLICYHVPSYIIGYWAGDYFQALRHITAPAAQMVQQQSSLIITPEWEYSS